MNNISKRKMAVLTCLRKRKHEPDGQLDLKFIKMLGLRLKVHIFKCVIHKNKKLNLIRERLLNFDFKDETPHEIYDSLSTLKYMCYSAIFIFINCVCSSRGIILTNVLKAIESNKYISNKLKIINMLYLKAYYGEEYNIWQEHFNPVVRNLVLKSKLPENLHLNINELIDSYQITHNKHLTPNDKEPLKDYFQFQSLAKRKTILLQEFKQQTQNFCSQLYLLMFMLGNKPFLSVFELREFLLQADLSLAVHVKEDNELYFYSVNPALAIINNNYVFTSDQKGGDKAREGSEKDVVKLIRELKIAQIPYILTEDFSRAELLKFINFLSHTDLTQLKSLLFFMMSHGSSNHIIHTHDGQLNFISDILRPIQSNPTLKETNISFFNVQCRGRLNAEISTPDQFDEIQPTQIAELQPNISVFYSVPDSLISPRRPHIGTPFIQSLCKSFRNSNCTTDVQTFFKNTCNDLKDDQYYAYLDCFDKSSELIVGDVTKSHYLKPIPNRPTHVLPLLKTIQDNFHKLHKRQKISDNYESTFEDSPVPTELETTTFCCIAANVNEHKFSKNLDNLKYFSSELDKETCFIDEEK